MFLSSVDRGRHLFSCSDFRAREIVLRARSCTQKLRVYKTVSVGANLHRLIYNVLNDLVLPICFGSTQRV